MSGVINGVKILIRTSGAVRLGSLLNLSMATRWYVKLAHTITMTGARVGTFNIAKQYCKNFATSSAPEQLKCLEVSSEIESLPCMV
jgi:hypothetical protein